MIALVFWACQATNEPDYFVPESSLFTEEEQWQGSLSFVSEQCLTAYALKGEAESCSDCQMQIRFELELLSSECAFEHIEVLSFKIDNEQRWWVEELEGWAQWGYAEAVTDVWELRGDVYLYE